jgi:flagellar motor switch protein FliM
MPMEEPQPYQFGRAAPQSPALLAAIERTGDKFGRSLRAIIEPLSGSRPTITPKPVDQTMFMMWDACVPAFTSLSLYRLHPVKGIVALRIDAGLVSCLVDRFYGGTGGKNAAAGQEFTPTESRIIDRLSNQIMKALVASWADFIAMEFSLAGRETGVAQAAIAAGDADVVVHSFEVNTGDPEPYTIEVVYPLEGLQGVDIVDTSKGADEVRRTDPMWRRQLEQRMEDVRLPARSILARPNLKMSELIALKPGDVINIHIARHLPLIVGNRVFAHGTIGEQDGRAAFMIEKLA